VPKNLKQRLVGYLEGHWQSPEDYVVGKFENHDIVFIGEYHRVKHDVELIQDLIPRLYAAGIRHLGIEFGCYEYQDTVDYLLTAPDYDESLARWLQFKQFVGWGYVEYEDLYRKAWELNHRLPPEASPFRIVGLNYRQRWDLYDENTREERRQVFYKGSSDAHMARVVLDEFVQNGEKALIYSGTHHAFTRYRQPIYNATTGEFYRYADPRMGHLVHDSIPDRTFCIILHRPWPLFEDRSTANYPVGGAIDAVMRELDNPRVGFDVVGTPFGELTDTVSVYAAFHPDFTLSDFCDGYIYQKPFSKWVGCTVDTLFVTEENFQEALDFSPLPDAEDHFDQPSDFIKALRADVKMQARLDGLR